MHIANKNKDHAFVVSIAVFYYGIKIEMVVSKLLKLFWNSHFLFLKKLQY